MVEALVAAYDPELEVELDLYYAFDAELEVELDLYYAYDANLEVEIELVDNAPTQVFARVTPEEVARAALARRAAAVVTLDRSTGRATSRATDLAAGISTGLAPGHDDRLDDDWFGSFDETNPAFEAFEDQPTSPFRRFGDWLLGRAA